MWNLKLRFYDPFISVNFFKAAQLKSSLLTIKVFELTFYVLGWCNFLIVSGVLVGVRLCQGAVEIGQGAWILLLLGTGYPLPAQVRRLLSSYQRQRSMASRLRRSSGGVHGVPANREPLRVCLTMCKGRLRTFPWLASPPAKASAVFTRYCSWARNRSNLNR